MDTAYYTLTLLIAAAALMAVFSIRAALAFADSAERLAKLLRAHAGASSGARAAYRAIFRQLHEGAQASGAER